MNTVDYRHELALGGSLPHMKRPETQTRWDAFLRAFDGVPLSDAELKLFREMTGRQVPRVGGYSEAVAILGRQAGKDDVCGDFINADAVHAIVNGEQADGLFSVAVAQDHRSSVRTLFHRIAYPWRHNEMMKRHVVAETSDSLTLDCGLTIVAMPCRPQAMRGMRARRVAMNETGHYRNSEGFPVDIEMRRAVLPMIATTGGKVLIVSSPFLATDLLGELHRRHYGREDSPTLIIQGDAPSFNPTLPTDYLEKMREDDPEAYASEVLGQFRQGTSALLDEETISACTAPFRERRPEPGRHYVGHFDASGGAHDAAAASVGHSEDELGIVDAVRRWPSPHDPSVVMAEAAAFFHSYGVRTVQADRYAGQFPVREAERHSLRIEHCALDRSALYANLLPRARSASVLWPDDPTLLRELRGLIRKNGFAGKVRIDHRPGHFDDVAVVVAGVVHQLSEPVQRVGFLDCRW